MSTCIVINGFTVRPSKKNSWFPQTQLGHQKGPWSNIFFAIFQKIKIKIYLPGHFYPKIYMLLVSLFRYYALNDRKRSHNNLKCIPY